MIDAFYILKENGIRIISKNYGGNDKSDTFDDMVTGFFSAMEQFSKTELEEGGIKYVQFQSNRRLYYKDFKINNNMVKFVILTSRIKNENDPYNRLIGNKSIKIKWVVEGLRKYIVTNASPPENVEKDVKEKIDVLLNSR
jgi:hypothetical protein